MAGSEGWRLKARSTDPRAGSSVPAPGPAHSKDSRSLTEDDSDNDSEDSTEDDENMTPASCFQLAEAEGQQLRRAGRHTAALESFHSALGFLEKIPPDVAATSSDWRRSWYRCSTEVAALNLAVGNPQQAYDMAEEIMEQFDEDAVALYLRGRALMAMDAAGDAVMDLSRALDTIQKHGRRRKLETEVATHLREAEKRLRSSASAPHDDIYLPSTAAYRVLDTAKGVYEYTKASSAAISKIADAIAPLTSLTGAIMEAHGPPLLSTMDNTFLACHDRLRPYVAPYVAPLVRHTSVVAETKVVKPFLRVLNAAEDSIAYYLPETTSELEHARIDTANTPEGGASGSADSGIGIPRRSARLVCAVSTVLKRRALACLQSGPSAPAGLVATTTYLTGSTLTYCCNAWIEPTLRLCKNGTLSLLASFGDLEGIEWVQSRIAGFASSVHKRILKPIANTCLRPFRDLEGIEWMRTRG